MMLSLVIAGMSSRALQDDSTTVVPIQTSFDEDSISKITFVLTFEDSAANGPAGDYLQHMCSQLHRALTGFT